MTTLSVHILKRIGMPFLMAVAVLLLALSLERLMRLIRIVTAEGAPFYYVLELQAYLTPHYLGLAVPAALFFGALFSFRRMHEDSELAITQSAGISLRALLKPVVAAALILSVIMLIIGGFVQPFARYAYRAQLHNLAGYNLVSGLQPGSFTEINDNMTIYADTVMEGGDVMQGFFSVREKPEESITTYATAKRAFVVRDENTGQMQLTLRDGNIVEVQGQKEISRLAFAEYPWKIGGDINEPYGARGQDEREMTFFELARGGVSGVKSDSTRAQELTELHYRIVHALSLPVLVMLALPFALIGTGRAGRSYGLVAGVAALVLYEKILGVGEAYAEAGKIRTELGIWLPLLALLIFSIFLVLWKSPVKIKHPEQEATK